MTNSACAQNSACVQHHSAIKPEPHPVHTSNGRERQPGRHIGKPQTNPTQSWGQGVSNPKEDPNNIRGIINFKAGNNSARERKHRRRHVPARMQTRLTFDMGKINKGKINNNPENGGATFWPGCRPDWPPPRMSNTREKIYIRKTMSLLARSEPD